MSSNALMILAIAAFFGAIAGAIFASTVVRPVIIVSRNPLRRLRKRPTIELAAVEPEPREEPEAPEAQPEPEAQPVATPATPVAPEPQPHPVGAGSPVPSHPSAGPNRPNPWPAAGHLRPLQEALAHEPDERWIVIDDAYLPAPNEDAVGPYLPLLEQRAEQEASELPAAEDHRHDGPTTPIHGPMPTPAFFRRKNKKKVVGFPRGVR